ncbi:MAG: glycosyltransferase family 2 protein [Bacteroidota bacterium]
MLAPLVLFTYNRLEETQQTICALQKNILAKDSELIIFSDGPKNENGQKKIKEIREYLRSIKGFKKVQIIESKVNKGLAKSIIDGVTQIIEEYGRVIVLEDDLITSPNFLNFMNQALNFYNNDNEIISISGYTLDLPSLPGTNDFYFGYRASSWGWATWEDRWKNIEWDLNDYNEFKEDRNAQKIFNRGGSDLSQMLENQVKAKIDSWAIRFCYHQSKSNLKTVFPASSKIRSIGFGSDATHTSNTTRFETKLDSGGQTDFIFDHFHEMDENLAKEFRNKFSIKARAFDKIRQILR